MIYFDTAYILNSNDRHLLAAAPHVGMTGRDVIGPGAPPGKP